MSESAFERLRAWAVEYPGSTRGVASMRIGLTLLAWGELGEAVQPHKTSPLLSVFFYASSFLSLVGYRAAWTTFAAGVAYMLVLVFVPNQMLHHTYLLAVSTMLLALTPCGRSLSIDRLLAVRRARAAGAPLPEEHGNLWALRLIALELTAVFFWGGYNKITFGTQHFQTAFLTGDRIEQILVYYYSGLPVQTPGWAKLGLALMGTGVVVFEMAAAVLLWIPKCRLKVLAACVVMTSCFQVVLAIRAFGLLSYVLYLAFVPPELVHRAFDRLLGSGKDANRPGDIEEDTRA